MAATITAATLRSPETRQAVTKLVRRCFSQQSRYSPYKLHGDGWNWEIRYERGRLWTSDYHDVYKGTWTDPPDESALLWWCTSWRDFHPDTWQYATRQHDSNRAELLEGAIEAVLAALGDALKREAERDEAEATRRNALALEGWD